MGELWPGGVRSAPTQAAGSFRLNAPRVVEKPWARIELRVVHAVRIPDAGARVTDALRPPEWSARRENAPECQRARRRPILPRSCPLSIFGAGELDFRVRDGNGYGLSATVTGLRLAKSEFMAEHQICVVSSACISRLPTGADEASWRSSPRPLVALCCSHRWPSTCALSSR